MAKYRLEDEAELRRIRREALAAFARSAETMHGTAPVVAPTSEHVERCGVLPDARGLFLSRVGIERMAVEAAANYCGAQPLVASSCHRRSTTGNARRVTRVPHDLTPMRG